MNEMPKADWKIKFPAIVLLVIGIFFLALQVLDFISSKSERLSIDQNQVSVKLDQLLTDLKTYTVILLAIISGLLLWRLKSIGWILGMPVLLWYLLLVLNGIYMSISLSLLNPGFLFLVIAGLVLVMSITLLSLNPVREKIRVGRKTYLPTLLVLMAIAAMHFLLK